MKKRVASLLLVLMLLAALALPVFAAGNENLSYVTDTCDLISDEEAAVLNDFAVQVADLYNCGVYLVIVDHFNDYGESVDDACVTIHDMYDLGLNGDGSAFLLLMSMSERDYSLRSFGEIGMAAMSDRGSTMIADQFKPYFAEDDWYGGFKSYYNESVVFLDAAASGDPIAPERSPFLRGLMYAFIPSVLVAFLVCTILKSQMKAAEKKLSAQEYIKEGGVDIQDRSDIYTHTTTTRTKIERESSSGSGSGSSSSNGSSGKF